MARMPGVEWVGEHGSKPMSQWDVLCVHTIVGNPPAHAAHFSTRADGHIYQSRDTGFRSAANLNGNYRVIAVENDDFGPEFGAWSGSNVPGFTDAQCEAIARICVWANQVHGIPLVLCPDSRPGSRGIAYHRQGIDGNWSGFAYGGRVSGGEVWSSSAGKVCPGDRRIRQLIETIIPRARVLAGLEKGDTVSWNETFPRPGDGTLVKASDYLRWTSHNVDRALAKIDALAGALSDDEANIVAAIRAMPTGGQVDVEALAAALGPLVARIPEDQLQHFAGQLVAQIPEATKQLFAQALSSQAI